MGATLKSVELTTDTVAAYLNNVGQHELLTADEEVMLAKRPKKARQRKRRSKRRAITTSVSGGKWAGP